jgi:putative transposase
VIVIQKLHARLTHIRKEYVRDVVTRIVKTRPSFIAIEDLNIKGMLKNKHLVDRVRKQNFYYFRTCLEQICKQNGIELRIVGRFFPSSKLCSCCGHKKVRLSLSERIFICDQCGIEIERDFNASLNLKYTMDYTIIT